MLPANASADGCDNNTEYGCEGRRSGRTQDGEISQAMVLPRTQVS
jgi:hypothetical protein